jgi:hypothetical protein
MSGSNTQETPGASGLAPDSEVEVRLRTLIARPTAAEFHALWESQETSPDVFAFIRKDGFSARDYAEAFLVDQYHRWIRGKGLPAEAYCRELRRHFEERLDDHEWDLVEHEFVLRRDLSDASSPVVSDFVQRFPNLADRSGAQFGTSSTGWETALDSTKSSDSDESAGIADAMTRTFMRTEKDCQEKYSTVELDNEASGLLIQESGEWSHSPDSVLGQSRPFAKLPPTLVQHIENLLEPRRYQLGEYLMHQDDPGDGLFLITDGQVEIQVTDGHGDKHVITSCGKGEILGEMALVTEEPRTADVVAITDVSSKFLPGEVFDELAGRFPVVSRVLTKLLADRLGVRGRDVLAGKTFDDYRILHRLGKGGMAIVYQASHNETGEHVALKMMSHRLVYDTKALEQFQRESKIIESFDHPHIVQMKGRFRAFRSFFIVLEYCDGVSLDVTLQDTGPLPLADFRQVIGQLASALAYAHQHNVVHRDVKPSNIMLTDCGDVKLMDFGLANPVDEAGTKGIVAGTPRYMPLQQLRGGSIDPRADLFALGCTAWKLLTGKDLITENSLGEIVKRHENWQVPEVDCEDPAVCDFIQNCLQHQAEDRIVDLSEIARWCDEKADL